MESPDTRGVEDRIDDLAGFLRDATPGIGDPRAEAFVETSAEAPKGLRAAFDHGERGGEDTWRDDAG